MPKIKKIERGGHVSQVCQSYKIWLLIQSFVTIGSRNNLMRIISTYVSNTKKLRSRDDDYLPRHSYIKLQAGDNVGYQFGTSSLSSMSTLTVMPLVS